MEDSCKSNRRRTWRRGGNCLLLQCCRCAYSSHVIFDRVGILESHKQNLPVTSTAQMTQSDYIYETVFLERLRHLKETALLVNAYVHWMDLHLFAVWKLWTTLESVIFKYFAYHHTPQIFYNLMIELHTNHGILTVIRKPRQTCIHKRPPKYPTLESCFPHDILQVNIWQCRKIHILCTTTKLLSKICTKGDPQLGTIPDQTASVLTISLSRLVLCSSSRCLY
jgi:hypothetical protein